MATKTIISKLVNNILDVTYDKFTDSTLSHAKNRIIDVMGCVVGGINAPGSREVSDLVKEWGGKEESTVLVHGFKAPAHNAAMVNSIVARSYDFELAGAFVDGRLFPSHISSTSVPSAFAVAEREKTTGQELLTALILGDDIACRFAAASRLSLQSGWEISMVNAFAVTAIAGKLLKLNEDQLLNAFGIVMHQLSGTTQGMWDGCHTFKLTQGTSAFAGIFSAELAARGFVGLPDPLQCRHGYFNLYARDGDPELLLKNLGKEFYSEGEFKPYSCCRGNHPVIDCALAIVSQHDITPDNIERVTIEVAPTVLNSFAGQPFKPRGVPQINALFNIQYNAANALIRKATRPEHFHEDYVWAPEIVEMSKKISITDSIPPEKRRAAKLTVTLKDGTEHSHYADFPKGDPVHNPMSREDLKTKFRANVDFSRTVAREKAERALQLIENLEEVQDITTVTQQLVM
jgi:2-methylcitrate dehydratase PrpD